MARKQTPKEMLARAQESKESYAQVLIKTAAVYAAHGVYERMMYFHFLARTHMEKRYDIPADRPVVHIDIGSGTGALLHAISTKYKEMQRKHCLIGIEVNDVIASHSIENLRQKGHTVEAHIHGEEKAERMGKNTYLLRRSYPVHEATLSRVQLTPDARIVIVQDDARRDMRILMSILDRLRAQGIHHVDSISLGLMGFGGDLAQQDSRELHQSNNFLSKRETPRLARELISRTCKLAQELLGLGGSFITYSRLSRGKKLEELFFQITGHKFPEQEDRQALAKMMLAKVMLGKEASRFHERMGSVLYPHFEEVEAKGTLDFSTFSPYSNESVAMREVSEQEMDLFGLSLVRADMHDRGATVGTIVVGPKEDTPEQPS